MIKIRSYAIVHIYLNEKGKFVKVVLEQKRVEKRVKLVTRDRLRAFIKDLKEKAEKKHGVEVEVVIQYREVDIKKYLKKRIVVI